MSPNKMMIAFLLIGIALVACSGGGQPVVINGTPAPPLPTLAADRVARGESLYASHCAGCHGLNLEGAPNWQQPMADGSLRPPPQDSSGHTWHHPDSQLVAIILEGGAAIYGGTMPPFKDKLSEEDALAILEFFKSKWGQDEREFQWWITALSQ
jgi:mono/diheme cytochrome c family protein